MAEVSYPAASYNGGAVTDAEYQRLPWAADGLIGGPWETGGSEAVYANGSGREVHIRPGRYGRVLGRTWTSGPDGATLPLDANSSGSTRVDTVVLRLDRSTWLVRAAVRKGTPGSGAPALVRQAGDTGVFEIPLADVPVPNNATTITAEQVQMRAAFAPATLRPARLLADVTSVASPGDIYFEQSTSRFLGWTGTSALVLGEDTDFVTLATSGSTAGPNANAWTNNSVSRVRRIGAHVHLRIAIKRWSSSGLNLSDTDGSVPFILPAGFRPSVQEVGFGFHSRSAAAIRVETDGSVRIFPLESDLPAGRTLQGGVDYMI